MKIEKKQLEEAYQEMYQVSETTNTSDNEALGPDEERQPDGSVKNVKTGETVYTPKEKVEEQDQEQLDVSKQGRPFAASSDVLDTVELDKHDRPDEDGDIEAMIDVHAALIKKQYEVGYFKPQNNTLTLQTASGDEYVLKIIGKKDDHSIPISLR